MITLFVYDSSIAAKNTDLSFFNDGDTVYLFPLTSRFQLAEVIADKIKGKGCILEIAQTAQMINLAAENLRNRYIRFVAELPEKINYKGKGLKEFFAVDAFATLWWFSLIAEKNTYKSDSFNRLAQLDSIIEVIKEKNIKKIIFCCNSRKLRIALSEYALGHSISFIAFLKNPLEKIMGRICGLPAAYYFYHIFLLIKFMKNFGIRTYRIKSKIDNSRRTLSFSNYDLMMVTPYPNIDIDAAKRGEFKNRFYPGLQEALEAKGQNILWFALYIENNTISFSDSLEYAKGYRKNSTAIFFIEEFNLLKDQIKIFFLMLKNGYKFLRIEKCISRAHNLGGYNFYSIFREDWYSSFVGVTGYCGLLYYHMFKRAFGRIQVNKCLYRFEMHAWEKAMISAAKAKDRHIRFYGYQLTTIPPMLLNFFNDKLEIADEKPYALPKPDMVICSGNLAYKYMRASNWPPENLSIAEAIRFDYLKGIITNLPSVGKNKIVIALSINPEESSSILTITYDALKDLRDKEVWIKPHPFLDFKKVIELSGISQLKFPFQVKTGPIENFLPEARIVIVGESGASIEALAFGCDVIMVNVPEWINMSPLRDIKNEMIKIANSPQELKKIVTDVFSQDYKPQRCISEAKKMLEEYFCLSQNSGAPDRFLKLLS